MKEEALPEVTSGSAAGEPQDPAPGLAADLGLDRKSIRKIIVGLVVLLVVTAALGLVLRAPLTAAADWFVAELGLWGLFGGVMVVDAWILPPLTHEPLLFFAHAGGVPFVEVFVVASAASVSAGPLGYFMGRSAGRLSLLRTRFEQSPVEKLMRRRGATVVAAAAITPIPFAVSTWLAGASGMRFWPFLAACLVRIVKVAVYLSLIAAGWAAG